MIPLILNNTQSWHIEKGDTLDVLRSLPGDCVHCGVTSPPYWGLRDYDVEGQIGLEESLNEYIENLVVVFREFRRRNHCDGCATTGAARNRD